MIKIENKTIGLNKPIFTIAEIGSNHNRSKKIFNFLIKSSYNAGFDAVKFRFMMQKKLFH